MADNIKKKRLSRKASIIEAKKSAIPDEIKEDLQTIAEEWPTITKKFYELKRCVDDAGITDNKRSGSFK